MTPPPPPRSKSAARWAIGAILLLGAALAAVSYRVGRNDEEARATSNFVHRAELRHALTQEIFRHYEDALSGLATLFTTRGDISEPEFARASAQLQSRLIGAHTFEWVPIVSAAQRSAVEAEQRRRPGRGSFEFFERAPDGGRRRAADRAVYYPILFAYPLAGNEAALGYDLATGPTRDVLERAQRSRQLLGTPQVALIQGREPEERGVILVQPVFRLAGEGDADGFAGFLQCVFRLDELLESARIRQANTVAELMFVDAAETDVNRRVLHFCPAEGAPPAPSEQEFRSAELLREFRIPFGERDWRLLVRPRPGWLAAQRTWMPVLRSCSLLLLAGLVAGLIYTVDRRTKTIERQVAERTAELAVSRRQLASMLHALPGMSYRCTYEGRLVVEFVSEGALALTGWAPDEFISRRVHMRDCIHPDDLPRVRAATLQALQEKRDLEVDYRVRTKSGQEKWVLSRGRGVYNPDGSLLVLEGLAIDITPQRSAESARLDLERKLLEGQKLESLGLLAGGIAHDFNNLLSSILGNASMARLSVPDGGAEDQLRAIESAALRAAELCRQMLAYAGKGRFVVEPVDLTVLTEELLPLLKISIAHQAALTLALERGLPTVNADATQVRQVVMNLVLNAADAIAGRNGGEIVIASGRMQADAELLGRAAAGAGLTPGEYVYLEVRDNGVGMTPEVMAKIFDPFFTTKFAGRGLGLAAVLGIVRGHHGALQVESTPGKGSIFRLLLPPLRTTFAAAKPVVVDTNSPWMRGGSVLVIDDEEQVREVMVAMLKVGGFTATSAPDGETGLAVFRENPTAYDIIVLDLLMPGMNGEETFRALRAVDPEVRIVIVSGFGEADVLGRLGRGPRLGFLPKPFTRTSLERKLREMLT